MACKWHRIILFRVVLALIGTGQAIAETDPADKVASGFADLAGSKENAVAIVRGMNAGKVIALRGPSESGATQVVAFNLAEGPLTFSEIEATFSRVRTRFTKQGVTQPTVEQLQAALVPGISESPRIASAASNGMPRVVSGPGAIQLASGEQPELVASAWGRYRPTERPSRSFEKFPGIS
ncbi:hypothetical protein [Usitatibacter palustris]|uniref:Uncharacterized protein n=1 Tax=Usitatibacter palustris TaxID=2732487 RepID=A0A6M4H3H5_9PROT|nr:hypothetical protein [Usitatibacter palustris]QJR13842.1 hypothetical protein DSM104440_00632 [Usitatibacter palustris]